MNNILTLNAGSSSLKFAIFDDGGPIVRGQLDRLGQQQSHWRLNWIRENNQNPNLDENVEGLDQAQALDFLLHWLEQANIPIEACGHRVVHGGSNFAKPVKVTPAILDQLQSLEPLAPLHQPHNLAPIRRLFLSRPHWPQVACFDTGFFADQPRLAELFAIPRSLIEQGQRRYGFHGLSYQAIVGQWPLLAPHLLEEKVVVAHLGSGASLCAIDRGQAMASSMGFSALDGLPMSTRTGSIDAGLILHWMDLGWDQKQITETLYKKSGLLGLSGGISGDMRDLLKSDQPAAKEAIDYFCYRVAREMASAATAMGGLDAIVFTAGIGEHQPEIRAKICQRLQWLGVSLDEAANQKNQTQFDQTSSKISLWTIPTDEEKVIAAAVRASL